MKKIILADSVIKNKVKVFSFLRFYTNLTLKKKFFLFNFLIIFLVCIISQIAIKIALNIYDSILYDEAAQVLNLSTTMIESEFKRIDGISLNIVSDSKVQEYVEEIKYSSADYDKYRATNNMVDKIFSYVSSEKAISSIHFIDTKGNQYYQGYHLVRLSEDNKELIKSTAQEHEGNNVIIGPTEKDPSVICAREIRAVPNLSLEPMGTLVLRIDMEKLVNKYLNSITDKGFNFLVFSGEKPIYVSYGTDNRPNPLVSIITQQNRVDDTNSFIKLISKLSGNSSSGYVLETINNKKFFIAYTKSNYTGWVYINAIPYESIFIRITSLSSILTFIFIAIFILTLPLSLYFARNITKPLEMLTKKMKKVEEGNFEIIEDKAELLRSDEIGQLNNDFDIMICKINTLIKEDYTKQIIIKDSQYKALQAQINPHFLYNTLDSINWMAKINHENSISLMVESLGSLLRTTISNKDHVITLGQEIEILNNYINIQKMRFEERLNFKIEIDSKYNRVKIPKLTLQPIVENSINYGLENMAGPCTIMVTAAEKEDVLEISVSDNGPGMEDGFIQKIERGEVVPKGLGIGLKNIHDRIRLIFGEKHGVCVFSRNGEGTTVHVSIPVEMEEIDV